MKMLMELGMGKGAAIALLLAGPGISLLNMLAIAKLFGVRRAAVYVCLIVLLAALAGWFLGVIVYGGEGCRTRLCEMQGNFGAC